MKHIKSYKIFEGLADQEISDIIIKIEDIFLGLTDTSFEYELSEIPLDDVDESDIAIDIDLFQYKHKPFSCSDVKDTISELESHLSDIGSNIGCEWYIDSIVGLVKHIGQGEKIDLYSNQELKHVDGLFEISIRIMSKNKIQK